MRVLIIGLGGAGCRLLDSFYLHDRRSSSIRCIDGIAIDRDADTLDSLINVPAAGKLFYRSLDPTLVDTTVESDISSTIFIDEIIARIQALDKGDVDAIFIAAGLGGTMAGAAATIVTHIRSAMIEPVFGLFTLPCTNEGPARSAAAADAVDLLFPLLDGIILFDNETWYGRLHDALGKVAPDQSKLPPIIAAGHPASPTTSGGVFFRMLNDLIARRIGLLFRAGEYHEAGASEIAEVVLDSGEVLNTIRGMGFIALGYASSPLVQGQLEIMRRFRPAEQSVQESHQKASRVVELAKSAIFNELSVPCDLGSAKKALILIAGPSHEMSMKGFMTVRKWIDRSIEGLEVRSGDYPVSSSRYLAVIIILAGISHISRLDELRSVRDSLRTSLP